MASPKTLLTRSGCMDLSFVPGRNAARRAEIRIERRTESDQQYGGEERWWTVRALLDRALEDGGRRMTRRPLQIQRGDERNERGRRCGNADDNALHTRLLRLLGLAAARIGCHLAAAMMLRRGAAGPTCRWRRLPSFASTRGGNSGHDEPSREHNRDSLPHVQIFRRADLRCQTD